jgi:hypothetical protein
MKFYRVFDIEIGEYSGNMTYDNALGFCGSMGPEWRLPRVKELRMIKENYYKKFIDLFPIFYWTSDTESVLTTDYPVDNLKVKVYNINNGRIESRFSKNLDNVLAVLPVRNIQLIDLNIKKL